MENYLNIFDNRTGEFLKMTRPHVVKGRKYKETIILIDAQGIIVDISGKEKWGPEYGIPIIGQIGDGRFELRVNEDNLKVMEHHEEGNRTPVSTDQYVEKIRSGNYEPGKYVITDIMGTEVDNPPIDLGKGMVGYKYPTGATSGYVDKNT